MAFSLKKMTELLSNVTFWRGLIALLSFVIIWEILSKYFPMLTEYLGMMEESAGKQKLVPVTVPWIGKVPPPTEVVAAWGEVFFLPGHFEQAAYRLLGGAAGAEDDRRRDEGDRSGEEAGCWCQRR